MNVIFFDIGIVIITATVLAYIGSLLKQPLIPAYVLAGLILGPLTGLIANVSVMTTMSEIGIAFLLFIVGLEIDFKKLSNVGVISTIGGTIQIILLFTTGFLIATLLGFIGLEAIYMGIIISFGSTMVVIKLLSDSRQLYTLHGRIIIGILLMEDFFAIIAISVLTTINNISIIFLLLSIMKGLGVIVIAYVCSKFIFPVIFRFAAKNQELLLLLSISVCLGFALMFHLLDLSLAIGAFIAGVTLANLPYNAEIIGKVRSLRDFFSTIFFVSLGMQLVIGTMNRIILPLIFFLSIVLFVKPFIVMFLCAFFGYKKRVGFASGMSLMQTSEFSLIIIVQGLLLGHVGQTVFTIAILTALITMVITTYLFKYEDKLYAKLGTKLTFFDRFESKAEDLEYLPEKYENHVVLCGYNRTGYGIIKKLKKLRKKLLVVDFNPEVIKKLMGEKVPCLYGDIGDIEVLERLDLKKAQMAISTVPTKMDNLMLIHKAKEDNKKIVVFVTATDVEEALSLYEAGADYVILPHFLGGEHVSILIENIGGNINKMIAVKLKHIKELEHRRVLGHEHPRHD